MYMAKIIVFDFRGSIGRSTIVETGGQYCCSSLVPRLFQPLTRDSNIDIEIERLLHTRHKCYTLKKVRYIDAVTVLRENREDKRERHQSRHNMACATDGDGFGVGKDDTEEHGQEVVGSNGHENMPE